MAYATVDDLVPDYVTPAPANAQLLLTRATRRVDQALLCAVYDVDEDGIPTDPDHVTALRDATCEQVAAWVEAGEDGTGASADYSDVQICSVRVELKPPSTRRSGYLDPISALAALRGKSWYRICIVAYPDHPGAGQDGLTGAHPVPAPPCPGADLLDGDAAQPGAVRHRMGGHP